MLESMLGDRCNSAERQDGQGMTKYRKNPITIWTKTNHIHFCAVFLKAKDVLNFIRQYLFLRLDFNGEYYSEQTLRASIVALTGWNPEVITNAIAKLKKSGEIERVNPNHYRFNPDIGNRYRYGFRSKYNGLQPFYDERHQKLIDDLEKKIRHTRLSVPLDREDMDAITGAEEEEIETMVALAKIENLERTLADVHQLLIKILHKVEIPTEVKDEVERHLKLVKNDD